MRQRDVLTALDTIGHYHQHLLERLPAANEVAKQYAAGAFLASSPTDSIVATGGEPGRPTERRAGRVGSDQSVADQAELAVRLRAVLDGLDWLDRYCGRYPAVRRGGQVGVDEGCASCARVPNPNDGGRPWWSAVHSTPRSVDGVPVRGLCRWCYDACRERGAWPPLEAVRLRLEGRRVPAKLMDAS